MSVGKLHKEEKTSISHHAQRCHDGALVGGAYATSRQGAHPITTRPGSREISSKESILMGVASSLKGKSSQLELDSGTRCLGANPTLTSPGTLASVSYLTPNHL